MNVTQIEFSMLFSRNLTKQAPQSPVKVSKQEFHVSRSRCFLVVYLWPGR